MLKSFRDFLLAFIISGIVFSLIAVVAVGVTLNIISPSSDDGSANTPFACINTLINFFSRSSSKDPVDIIGPGAIGEDGDRSASFNMLVLGVDYQPDILNDYGNPDNTSSDAGLLGPKYRRVQADSVMIVCVNKEKKEVAYIPLPSNMLLSIDGVPTTLGEIYHDEGLEFFIDKVYGITGVPIDYYAVVNIAAAASIVDAFDGISYNVPCDMYYSDPAQNLEISLKAGEHDLTGEQALGMLRFNNYTDPANTRTKTMISFAKAMVSKMTGVMYVAKIPGVFEQISEAITTNMELKDVTDNLPLIAAYPEFKVTEVTYPEETEDGTELFTPNVTAAIEHFAKYRAN